MTKKISPIAFKLIYVPVGFAASIMISQDAKAVNFNVGEIEGQFDSSLSIGASWGTAKPDKDLIGMANGGNGFTQTNDDGRLNFKRGETFSKIFKGIHDVELKYNDFGVFARGKYWYDFELKDEDRQFKDISDHNRKEGAKSSGAEVLDAFVYHNHLLFGNPGTVRLGKQVVSWGESTFIGNSINSINPIDVSAFRRPGAEIKEGLIPVNMFFMSQGITDNFSAEAFVQLEWDQTVLDNCGTFFSVTDVVQDGCDGNYNILDPDSIAQIQAASAAGLLPGVTVEQEGLVVPRGSDRDARDSGQWGVSLRWQGDEAEYAAYVMNYHSRLPIVSTQTADRQGVLDTLAAAAGPLGLNAVQPMLLGRGNYFLEYPEDIRLYGVSFNTTLPTGTAWSGEISYRPNMPLQVNTVDLTAHLVTDVVNPFLASGFDPAVALAQAGKDYHGYQRKEVTQAQSTFIHFFDQAMGADRFTLIGEVGITRIGAMTDDFDNRFGRDSIYGVPETALAAQRYGSHGFYTTNSWGYRARAIWDFNNVIAGVNIKPNLAWSHDVDGNGPVFTEGTKAASVGIDAEYLNAYTASLSYTNFFGGDYNINSDRDFVALSVGVNF